MKGVKSNLFPGLILAAVSVGIAWILRQELAATIGTLRFLTFFPVIILCGLVSGPVSSLAAAVVSFIIVVASFERMDNSVSSWVGEGITVCLFGGIGLMIVWLSERVRRSRATAAVADEARLHLAAIVDSSDEAIVSKSLDGVVQSWNNAATRLFGYPAADIVGKSSGRLVPADLLNEYADDVETLKRGERVIPFETIRLHQTGIPIRVMITMSPLKNRAGDVIGVVEIARDMNERVAAEAALRRANMQFEQNVAQLRVVLDTMTEGVIVADPEGNLIEWSRSALVAHGYESVEEVRRSLAHFANIFQILDGDRLLDPSEWPMVRVLRGETLQNLELRVRRLDKPRELIVNYGGSPVYDSQGRITMAILTLHDVTEERRAQATVQETALRLSLALDASGMGDWYWDPKTDIVTLSPTAAKIFGVPADELATRDELRNLVDLADREYSREASAKAMRERRDYSIEYRVHPRTGGTIWVAAKGRGEYDSAGNPVRMLGVVQDITLRKQFEESLRESQQWLELAVSIAQMGTFRIDLRTQTVDFNETGRAIYGFLPDEVLTFEAVSARFYPLDAAMATAHVRRSFDPAGDRRFEMDHRIVHRDGSVHWLRIRGRTEFEETATGPVAAMCVGTFIEVTSQKEIEHQREQSLGAEQAARAQAEYASRMKDEFLATLSHELRTPLNAIMGWSQILSTPDISLEDCRQGIEVIDRNAKAQAQIIEDLLDMSRIISGKVRLDVKAVDLSTLVTTAVETVRPTADQKGVRLQTQIDLHGNLITADPHRLQQVLWNLLTNAIKFTPKDGQIMVSLSHDVGCVKITVADTGEGIRPDFVPHVFDRFRQADASTTRRHGGLGLGLAIVKQLAELHGGSVRCESAGSGMGATFTVILPTASIPMASRHDLKIDPGNGAAKLQSDATVIPSVAGLRVLVVDDEPDARHLVKRLLSEHDVNVTLAASSEDAMLALGHEPRPDVLVSDIGMPVEDGYGLIARVRQAGLTMPAIALTAYVRREDRERALEAGFQAHLPKPLDPAALVATIARVSGR